MCVLFGLHQYWICRVVRKSVTKIYKSYKGTKWMKYCLDFNCKLTILFIYIRKVKCEHCRKKINKGLSLMYQDFLQWKSNVLDNLEWITAVIDLFKLFKTYIPLASSKCNRYFYEQTNIFIYLYSVLSNQNYSKR